jgi:hypothetical protein
MRVRCRFESRTAEAVPSGLRASAYGAVGADFERNICALQ